MLLTISSRDYYGLGNHKLISDKGGLGATMSSVVHAVYTYCSVLHWFFLQFYSSPTLRDISLCWGPWGFLHYIDVIMTTVASQITSLTVVYSTVYSDADQRKHQSSASLAFVWGIHRDRWIHRTKGQLRGKCFHLRRHQVARRAASSAWFVI